MSLNTGKPTKKNVKFRTRTIMVFGSTRDFSLSQLGNIASALYPNISVINYIESMMCLCCDVSERLKRENGTRLKVSVLCLNIFRIRKFRGGSARWLFNLVGDFYDYGFITICYFISKLLSLWTVSTRSQPSCVIALFVRIFFWW